MKTNDFNNDDKNVNTSTEDTAVLETSFEDAAAMDKPPQPEPDDSDDNPESNDMDWENLEIENIEEDTEPRSRKGLTDSDAEVPEGDLELDNSRKKIKKDRREREEQNPFRSATLTPDLSESPSSYNRVSESVESKDSGMQVGSTKSKDSKIYSSSKSQKNKKSFLSRFFVNLTILIVLVILFTTVLFSLITFGVIPREQYSKYLSFMSRYLPAIENKVDKRLSNIVVNNTSGKWINSRNGFLFVVSGEAVNKSNKTVNYIRLRSQYSSTGNVLYSQEFYAGNTLSLKELRNSSVSQLEKKLKKKSGDVDFDDIDTFAGKKL